MNSRHLLRAVLLALGLMTAAACDSGGGTDPAPIKPGPTDPTVPTNPDNPNAQPLPTDPNDGANALKDTDCDGLSDEYEFSTVYEDGLKTNPGLADTDGDGLPDGLEVGVSTPVAGTSCTLPQDLAPQQNTSPVKKDTDGDGLPDGLEDANHNGKVDDNETHPGLVDSDCDGLRDGPSKNGVKGEDQNANGLHDASETDPRRFDTDGDGISDGVELGATTNLDASNCTGIFIPDADSSSITDPRNPDTDGDGISDGAEDTNQNGRKDPGELNPANPGDATGPAAQACTTSNLRPVIFQSEEGADLKLALPPSFQEVTPIQVGTEVKGMVGYDATARIAFLAYRTTPPAGATDPLGDEEALLPAIQGKGALSNRTGLSFKTWEGFDALQAFHDQKGTSTDLKRRTDELVDALVPGSTGRLSGTAANVMGDFRLQMLFVHRSNQSLVVLIAVVPLAGVTGNNRTSDAAFFAKDLSDGSALAQFGEPTAAQCELFNVQTAKVDFIFVVDDSCSMQSSQKALAETANRATAALNTTSLDWRMAMVTSNYHFGTNKNSGKLRHFTRNVNKVKAWLTQNSTCVSGVCSEVPPSTPPDPPTCPNDTSQGDFGGCWVGTGGSGNEGLLGAGRKIVRDLVPATPPGETESPQKLRADASVVLILLGDADDQTTGATTSKENCGAGGSKTKAGTECEPVQNFRDFFGYSREVIPTNPLGKRILVHGIVCPSGQRCNDEFNPQPIGGVNQLRYDQVINSSGGVLGSIKDNASIATAMDVIIDTAIGNGGYKTLKPPIGASIKVAVGSVRNAGVCASGGNLPRNTSNGFDFDGRARTLSLFGSCIPSESTTQVAVSYRYWVDAVKDPNGATPCEDDPNYTPSEPDHCAGPLGCGQDGTTCVCKPNCGDTCGSGTRCNMTTCACQPILK